MKSHATAVRGVAQLPGLRHYSAASAGMRLLSCVQDEVGLEQGLTEQLPEVTGFDTTVSGCIATLQRQHGTDQSVYHTYLVSMYVCMCMQSCC